MSIDEAQDWQKEERDIIFHIFQSKNTIIADGLQQLVRTNTPLNWKVSKNKEIRYKEIVFPKKSLRQNKNLCIFQDFFAEKYYVDWKVAVNDKLNKGSIYVFVGDVNEYIIGLLKDKTKGYSKDKYDDLLFLTPPHLTNRITSTQKFALDENKSYKANELIKRSFIHTEEWKKKGLEIFDGTYIDREKDKNPQDGEYRLYNYESCRGLESFGVVALDMDVFFDNKISFYKEDKDTIKQGDLNLQTKESKALRYATMWSLIVFSRPVELLVITIKDKNSTFFKTIQEFDKQNSNIINIIE